MTTTFQERVYTVLRQVPKGKVTTYKDLANVLGIRSGQAVGQACKRNPYAPRVPCHRVVKSDGTIGGFSGATTGKHIRRKVSMLRKEGVSLTNGRIDLEEHRCHHENLRAPV